MDLKVISFNIRCADDRDGHSIAERAPRLWKVTKPCDADIIGFQEYVPNWEEPIKELFGTEYEIFNKYRTTTGHIESAPILWKKDKFDCEKKGYFWLSDTPEVESGGWDIYEHNRICTYAILKEKISGKRFTFINTHLGFGEENQIKSVNLILDYVKKISDLPTVVTGDFNMTPSTVQYKIMASKMVDVNAVTAKDWNSTFHGYEIGKYDDAHIDYCFVNDLITPKNLKVLDELVDGKFPSDHFGLFAEVEV